MSGIVPVLAPEYIKKILYLFIIFVIGIFQVTLLDFFKIFNVKPDLLLISAVIASLVFKFKWALFFSIFAGIFKDVFVVSTFGINTLLFCLWSFLILKLTKEIPIDNNFIRLILIFIIAFLHNIISGLFLFYSGKPIPLGIFLRTVSIGSIYTALVLLLVFKINSPPLIRFDDA